MESIGGATALPGCYNVKQRPARGDGAGLMRIEFIITHAIQLHPMALVKFSELKDEAVKQKIEGLTYHYPDKKIFC